MQPHLCPRRLGSCGTCVCMCLARRPGVCAYVCAAARVLDACTLCPGRVLPMPTLEHVHTHSPSTHALYTCHTLLLYVCHTCMNPDACLHETLGLHACMAPLLCRFHTCVSQTP